MAFTLQLFLVMIQFGQKLLMPLFVVIVFYQSFGICVPFQRAGLSLHIIPHDFDGKIYDVVIVKMDTFPNYDPWEFDARFDGPSGLSSVQLASYIPNVIQRVQRWVIDEYLRRGRIKAGSELHKALGTIERIMDGRSALVFITEQNDLNQIKAVLRVSRKSRDLPELPLQMRLSQFAIKEPLNIEEKLGLNSTEGGEKEKLELKSFIQSKEAEYDFIPALLRAAELYHLLDEGQWITDINKPNGLDDFKTFRAKPEIFVLECDQEMLAYYKRMKFTLVRSYPEKDTYIFATDAAGIQRIYENLNRRPGQLFVDNNRILTERNFFPVQLQSSSCSDRLSAKQTFYKEW